jgi:6-phosphogluconolactonase
VAGAVRRVLENPDAVAQAVAQSFRDLVLETLNTRDRFSFAVAGGSTPKLALEAISSIQGMPWDKIHVFFGDERCVPPDDDRSNFKMVKQALLDHVSIPHGNVHRIKGELGPDAARAEYLAQLEVYFDGPIIFDLVHLGLGPDGHIASLFPGSDALESPDPVVTSFPGPTLEPQVERVSLGLSVLNAAHNVQLIVTGSSKTDVLARLETDHLPGARVQGSSVTWFLDRAANGTN